MEKFDVIIIGGSYSGLSAALALGRALRKVLVIDAGKPANRFTPHSHNFITHDGRTPGEIAALARQQVQAYKSVSFENDFAISAQQSNNNFVVSVTSGKNYLARKIILATGIVDVMPDIPGFAACWGKSVLHCPYCHGYEFRHAPIAILGNGDYAYEFASLISNWTNDLQVFTNGPSTLSPDQSAKLAKHGINVVENIVMEISHIGGSMDHVIFKNGNIQKISALYARPSFIQHSDLSTQLGCELTNEGYIQVDQSQKTNVTGVFACGDNVTRLRTVSNAVSLGTIAGIMVSKELISEDFN